MARANWDEKGTNYDKAKVKTGFGISSPESHETPGLVVTPNIVLKTR
jgi:hypothetical protein